jgi:hypothetical protein
LAGPGEVRNAVGDLMERLTASWFGGVRHKTQSNCDYCPDVSAGGEFYESKGVGKSGNTFIYGGRLVKDREFVATGHRLWYAVWHHRATTTGLETREAVERAVLASLRSLYVVPFAAVDDICRGIRPTPLNSKYGGSDKRPAYGSGYVIRLSLLELFLTREWENGVSCVGESQVLRPEDSGDLTDGEQVCLLSREKTVAPGVPPYGESKLASDEHKSPSEDTLVSPGLARRYLCPSLWDL